MLSVGDVHELESFETVLNVGVQKRLYLLDVCGSAELVRQQENVKIHSFRGCVIGCVIGCDVECKSNRITKVEHNWHMMRSRS